MVLVNRRDRPNARGLATIEQTLGVGWTRAVRLVIGVSVFACGLASMAATSRLLFALARDRMLPGSRWLAFVAEGHRTPRNSILDSSTNSRNGCAGRLSTGGSGG